MKVTHLNNSLWKIYGTFLELFGTVEMFFLDLLGAHQRLNIKTNRELLTAHAERISIHKVFHESYRMPNIYIFISSLYVSMCYVCVTCCLSWTPCKFLHYPGFSALISRFPRLHGVSQKGHPFCFFYNSVEWWSICMKFLPDVAEEIQVQIISTKCGC